MSMNCSMGRAKPFFNAHPSSFPTSAPRSPSKAPYGTIPGCSLHSPGCRHVSPGRMKNPPGRLSRNSSHSCSVSFIQKTESSDFWFSPGTKKALKIQCFQCFPASPRRLERPTYRLGVKKTQFTESSKLSVILIFFVVWTFLKVAVYLMLFFPSNIFLFLPIQLAGY